MCRSLTLVARVGLAAVGAVVSRQVLELAPPGGRQQWHRTNHAGRTVSLAEGPAWTGGACLGLVQQGSPATWVSAGGVLAATALGALDDHLGATDVKGLRGHVGALRQGRVTTGLVKLGGLAVTGVLVAAGLDRRSPGPRGPLLRCGRVLVGGATVAAAANVVNLLDLRPGRALKVVVVASLPLAVGGGAGAPLAAAALGASLGTLPDDLAGRTMLGDTGANAAGALLGASVVAQGGSALRLGALGVLAALVLASERVSFTAVIARTPWLDALDRWGRPA